MVTAIASLIFWFLVGFTVPILVMWLGRIILKLYKTAKKWLYWFFLGNPPIYIPVPEMFKPDAATMLGYSGGMALYVADMESIEYLYEVSDKTKEKLDKHYPINFI